jgi:hypothetical protein
VANRRDFDAVVEVAGLYEVPLPPSTKSVIAVATWMFLIGVLNFVVILVQVLPMANDWSDSKIASVQRKSTTWFYFG